MKKGVVRKIVTSISLMLAMIMNLLPMAVRAEELGAWESIALTDITAEDTIAITMSKGENTWILPNSGTGNSLTADLANISDGTLTASGEKYGWTVTPVEGGYKISNGNGYLNPGTSNNGVNADGEECVWAVDQDYLSALGRFLGVYNSQNWRAYTSVNANIEGQTLTFWKLTDDDTDSVKITDIKDVLAMETGAEATVKGVVTLVDGRNIYIQDATGGICLYLSAADSSIQLGDTYIGKGTRTTYRGLPELTGVSPEKSDGMTLKAKETTIGALTTDDVCTYVVIKNLEVTEVYDKNGTYTTPTITVKDSEENTFQIYKAIIGKTGGKWDVEVGDTVNVKAAVGINNTTLQLRNTKVDEIEITKPQQTVTTPAASPAAGEVEKGTVVTFTSDEGALISYSTDGEVWAEGSTYTVEEAVTIKVKAVKDGVESETAEFAYTVIEKETVMGKLEEAPEDGDEVVICHRNSQTVLSTAASNNKLKGENVTFNHETFKKTDTMAYLTVSKDGENYIFEADGKYLTSGETGNGLSFAKDKESDLAKWTLEKQEDGTWYLMNVGAAYNGNHNQALEYYNGFTTYSVRTNNAAYKFEFYVETEVEEETLAAPKADVEAGEVEKGTVVTFTAEEGAVIFYSVDNGTTWTEGSTYTVEEAVTIKVKAVKDSVESETAEFAYTIKEETPEPGELDTIVTALAGADGAEFTVKGVVTLADGRNIYIQDATGGICLYLDANDKSIQLGDTLIGKGTRTTYRGLPELTGVSPEKSEGLTLEAKETTIGALTTEDVCTYVAIKGLEVTEVYDNNGTYSTPNITVKGSDGKTIQIYRAIVAKNDGEWAVKVGDKVDVTAAVGINNTTLQLRNTKAEEIVVVEAGESIADPTVDVEPGEVEKDTLITFTAEEGTVIFYSVDGGKTWTKGSTYKVDDEVTIQVKAVKGDLESKVVTFAYTVAGITYEDQAVSDISELKDGVNVVIYNKAHKTAISSKPNGSWYLKAEDATVEKGTVKNFIKDLVWTVKVNKDGTYSFYSAFDDSRSITTWESGNYAEVCTNTEEYPDNTWNIAPAKTEKSFYVYSQTVTGQNTNQETGPTYLEAYVRNGAEVFSGYFITPASSYFNESEYSLQFYIVNKDDAIEIIDDGTWDGVLTKGEQYVIYNVNAEATIGLWDEANYSMKAIPSTIDGETTKADNGAYVFTVDSMGRYYTFKTNGKFLATNNDEELFLIDPKEDGSAPETAKWYLKPEGDSYIIYNKEANYNGTPVCIEYFSSVFSGWTFNTKNELSIYLFNFYKLAEGTKVHDDIVQNPCVLFSCEDFRYIEQDFPVEFTLVDLAPETEVQSITYTAGEKTGTVTDYTGNESTFTFTILAADIDGEKAPESFTIRVDVKNSYDIAYFGEKEIEIRDEPFFENLTPAPNSQTKDDKKPVISAKIGNVGENPTLTMTVNDEEVEAVFEEGVLSYTPAEELKDGRTTVKIEVEREDGVKAEKAWSFTVGISDYQLYFGQLHSHTTYSDGSGSLETALEYVGSLPESANVDFVAFTDHSNYFDSVTAANPADAMNDKTLMTEESLKKWNTYKETVAEFNKSQSDIIAIAGFEMTWSGGPGHINSFNTDGLVSRNNTALNDKSGDAGMKLYYATMNKDNGETMHQFNHPGSTFGNFTDFSYWDEETDKRMFLVEVGNGEGQIGAGGYYPSYEEYTLALDQGWHVAPTNNQDNHKGRWGNANDARDVILTNDFSEQGIYDAIRARRIYATEDKNLQIIYTLNDEQMGTIFDEENVPEKINIDVTLYDPDNSDSIVKAEVIGDGGKVVYTWDDKTELAEGALSVELEPEYSYYYIRVTQEDGDLAVTAPVWVAKATQAGITDVTNDPEIAIVNEDETLTTTFFNNEASKATVKSITYTTDGAKVIGADTTAHEINANGSLAVPFTFKPDVAKRMTITVTAVMEIDGKEMTYKKDIIISVRDSSGELQVTPIKDVQSQAEAGYEYAIEGVVVSNASGYNKDTAFFDCIYVEDETAGICCFPVSGEFKIGDKVHIEGYNDFYQGEAELQVESIEVIGEGSVEPKEVTSKEINDLSVLGSLVTLKGTIESVEEVNGLIQTIMVKDENGDVARVFIDGYITTGKEVENCEVGYTISATGLSSYDNTWPETEYFARLRIRNREDIVCQEEQKEIEYEIIEGENGEYQIGKDTHLLIVSNAPFDKFVCVIIDDKKVDPSAYSASSGSTRIDLKKTYLDTLATGRHSITIQSSDGSASTVFTIEKGSEAIDPKPNQHTDPNKSDSHKNTDRKKAANTYETNWMALWMTTLLISLGVAGSIIAFRRKRS